MTRPDLRHHWPLRLGVEPGGTSDGAPSAATGPFASALNPVAATPLLPAPAPLPRLPLPYDFFGGSWLRLPYGCWLLLLLLRVAVCRMCRNAAGFPSPPLPPPLGNNGPGC